ncbi:Pr6Pr family membrane protein [Sphingosinicella sp.]|uniref:Pr6Pr family membrane protein n=1 Tax=Sphingosinicella sp. TaxID=1917971 RepID=UPI0040380187
MPDQHSTVARIAAVLIALAAWAGLAVQLQASIDLTGSAGGALWAMLRFFTVITNLIVALLFTAVAWGRPASPFALGAVMLAILLVGIVFALLLNGPVELSGGALLADFLLHRATPVLVPIWWLAFAPKGGLRRVDPLLWMLYPLCYFAYALARAQLDGRYPYPFMDAGRIGWLQTGLNAAEVAAGFLLAGLALVWLDRRLTRD